MISARDISVRHVGRMLKRVPRANVNNSEPHSLTSVLSTDFGELTFCVYGMFGDVQQAECEQERDAQIAGK